MPGSFFYPFIKPFKGLEPLKGSVKVPAESPPQFAGEVRGVNLGGSWVLYPPFKEGGRSLLGLSDAYLYAESAVRKYI